MEPVNFVGGPLVIQADATYTIVTMCLAFGETVLMGTGEITEARRGHRFLGSDGFAALAEQAGPVASLAELNRPIHAGARDCADRTLGDDVCLMLARRQ